MYPSKRILYIYIYIYSFQCLLKIPLIIFFLIELYDMSGDRIPVGASFSALVQTGPEAHVASCTRSTGFLSRRQSDQYVALNAHPHIVPRLKTKWSYTSTTALGLYNLLKGDLCLYLLWCIRAVDSKKKTTYEM